MKVNVSHKNFVPKLPRDEGSLLSQLSITLAECVL